MIQPGTILARRYRIVHTIAEGGLSWVYAVLDLESGERCAAKVLKPDLLANELIRERFEREAWTAARIDSESVVRVIHTGIADGHGGAPFIIMEHLDGVDLQELSDLHGPLESERVLQWLWQLSAALDLAHARGIVHRDLKPENLFLVLSEGQERIKVLDFGIAKLIEEHGNPAAARVTRTGQLMGTPMYMSPEQCLGKRQLIGPATDVWAVGLIAHRLLSGGELWASDDLAGLIREIAYAPFPDASARGGMYGAPFDEWLRICCARDPSERFQNASAATRALASAISSLNAHSRSAAATSRAAADGTASRRSTK